MLISKYLRDPIKELAETGKLSGVLLITATIISLFLSNTEQGTSYINIWHTEIGFHFLHKSIIHWINDGFMAVFFLLVGLEIKRELVKGELSSPQKAILPLVAASGGILFPALIYLLLNFHSGTGMHGWAIPTATDIAFSLGILSLLGSRISLSMKVFLTALAIIDDLGAIVIIATFYSSGLDLLMLLYALVVFLILLAFNRIGIRSLIFYFIPGLALWYFIMRSGIHPTIAGVLLAITIPSNQIEELEHRLNKPVNYFILPLFALANTAISLSFGHTEYLWSAVSIGIIAGLFIGKPLGIFLFSFLLVKLKAGILPQGMDWKQIMGLGIIAGIGFTMSIFIATLSFSTGIYLTISKLAILAGSTLSAAVGMIVLWRTQPEAGKDES